MWVWVNTYRYIFSGMNIHKSQLFWGSPGVPGFWPIPMSFPPILCEVPDFVFVAESPAVPRGAPPAAPAAPAAPRPPMTPLTPPTPSPPQKSEKRRWAEKWDVVLPNLWPKLEYWCSFLDFWDWTRISINLWPLNHWNNDDNWQNSGIWMDLGHSQI